MLSHYGLIKVLMVKAYMEGTIRFVGMNLPWYPFSRPGDRCYDAFCDHVIEGVLYLLPVFNGTLCQACWMGRTVQWILMVKAPQMLPMVSKESRKACFNDIMSWTMDVEQGAVTLVNCALWIDLRGMIPLGANAVRAGWGLEGVVKGHLLFVLSTFGMHVFTETYLQGSGLPLATKAFG